MSHAELSKATSLRPLKLTVVSGGLNAPSKTEGLLNAILADLEQALPLEIHYIKLSEIGSLLGGVVSRDDLPQAVQLALQAIESADALIVGTPVYRASFTGLFKHLFDFVDQFALADVPVLLAASGGSDRHALVLEHQLRPLFSFFQAQTLPIGVYATDADFAHYQVTSPALKDRIKLAVARALPVLRYAAVQPARDDATFFQHQAHVQLNKPVNQPPVLPSTQVPSLHAADQALHGSVETARKVSASHSSTPHVVNL